MTPTLAMADRYDSLAAALADPVERAALERQLPDYLRAQRWFGGQTRPLIASRVTRWVPLPPTTAGACLCLVTVTDRDGLTTEHLLPLRPLEVVGERRPLADALQHPDSRAALLRLALGGARLRGEGVDLVCEPTGLLAPGDYGGGRVVGAEQSNTSVIFDDAAILKLYRRVEPGQNPDVELGRYLTTTARFAAVPPLLASATLRDDAGYVADALLIQRFVASAGDGWAWALGRASQAFAAGSDPTALRAWLRSEGETLAGAGRLGAITGELHVALAGATGEALAPTVATATDVAAWGALARDEAVLAARALAYAGLDRPALTAALARAARFAPPSNVTPGLLTRVHGDYHLGQVLRAGDGFVLLDFEGEPARPLAERRARQHPLVDVAGMLRSWSYAARAAARARPEELPEGVVAAWEAAVRAAFLAAYWTAADAAPHPFLPADQASRDALLALFELRKALYELRYELNNRPDWLAIPAMAIERHRFVGSPAT